MVEIVEKTRKKWCDDLEEMLQCPICMMVPVTNIHQCSEGHIVCIDCKNQLSLCGFCNQNWVCRNRVAEDMCKLFNLMKTSLIDEEEEFQKLLTPDKVSIACQTQNQQNISGESEERPGGIFPCRIGTCNTQRFFDVLIKHLSVDHPNEYLKLPPKGILFEHSWTIESNKIMTFDRAIQIIDVGTFFLKLIMDISGNLNGILMMVHNPTNSKQYTYQLEINCCDQHKATVYSGEAITCRTREFVLPDKCLHVPRAKVQQMVDHAKNLTCTLLLVTKPNKEDKQKPQQATKGKNHKNRNRGKKSQANGQNEPRPSSSSSF